MRFALVNHIKTEAEKGFKGICPNCGAELIPKCGNYKIHHWAHKGNKNCDTWQEQETEWHRKWKNNYPIEWQEVSAIDEKTSEKHIADVRTLHHLVIEFQHSNITAEERTSREKFYKNMVWVVDGTRLKNDYPRFFRSIKKFHQTNKKGIFTVDCFEEVFTENWRNSSVPVVFDFKGLQNLDDKDDLRNNLYCLFPIRIRRNLIIAEIKPNAFIKSTIEGDWTNRIQSFIDGFVIPKQEQKNKIAIEQMQREFTRPRASEWVLHKGKMIRRKRL
jgi:competence protein CoiA